MSQREPFDRDEAELAGLLRKLPRGAPPEALDRQILQVARAAVASPRAPRRRWHWGGVAAAMLVLAIAPQWWRPGEQMAPVLLDAPVPTEPAAVESDAAQPSFVPEPESVPEVFDQASTLELPARAKQAAPPAPPPAPAASSPAPAKAELRPELRAQRELAEDTAGERAERRARPPASAAKADSFASPDTEVAGATPQQRLGEKAAEQLGRVRQLQREGRRDEAEALLRALLREHPDLDLPEDLRALIREPTR